MTALTRRDAVRLVALAVAVPVAARQVLAGADGVQLAIKGYDPVAYFTLGKPTKGVPEIAFEWDEHRYQFARTEHRELFIDLTELDGGIDEQHHNICAVDGSFGSGRWLAYQRTRSRPAANMGCSVRVVEANTPASP